MAVINPGCRQSDAIPADYTIWGLDDSSFQTLLNISGVDNFGFFTDTFRALSPGAAFVQQCIAAPPLQDGIVVSQCSQVHSSFDPVTFDSICAEDGFWTSQDDDAYPLSTNYGPGTGIHFEYNEEGDADDQEAIYEGLRTIHAERWMPETVYYMGALRWVAKAAAHLRENPTRSAGPSVDVLQRRVIDLNAEVAALEGKLAGYQKSADTFKGEIAQITPQVTAKRAERDKAWQELTAAQGAGDPKAAGAYLDAVKGFFVAHYSVEECRMDDGAEVLLNGIAPVSLDDATFDSAMKAMGGVATAECKRHPQAEFIRLLTMIRHYNVASAKIAEIEAAQAAGTPPDLTALQAKFGEVEGHIRAIDTTRIDILRLDPRQQALMTMLGLKLLALQPRMAAITASLAPCGPTEIRKPDGQCQPCASGLAPKAPVAPATESTECEATWDSCATISQVPSSDGTACEPCPEGQVFNVESDTGCVDKPKPVVKKQKQRAVKPEVKSEVKPAGKSVTGPGNPWEQ